MCLPVAPFCRGADGPSLRRAAPPSTGVCCSPWRRAFVSVRSASACRCILFSQEAPRCALPFAVATAGWLARWLTAEPVSCRVAAARPEDLPQALQNPMPAKQPRRVPGGRAAPRAAEAAAASSARNAGGAAIDVTARAAARASSRVLTKGRAALYSAQRALLPDLPAARAVSVAAHNLACS